MDIPNIYEKLMSMSLDDLKYLYNELDSKHIDPDTFHDLVGGAGWSKKKKEKAKAEEYPFGVMCTDIKKSSVLWARNKEAMNAAVNLHNEVIEHLVNQFNITYIPHLKKSLQEKYDTSQKLIGKEIIKKLEIKLLTNSSCPEGDAYIIWLYVKTDYETLNILQQRSYQKNFFMPELVKSIFTKFALLLQYFIKRYIK